MPIFGDSTSPYDEFVEKVTAETLTSENWELMIDICDRVNADPKAPKQCLLSVKKRLNHRDPHVVLFALSLLDCLWNNCGQKFRREVSSKEFIGELSYKCTNSNRVVAERARLLIKKWTESECKQDSSLSLVESLYKDLLDQGYSFEADPASTKKKAMFTSDPNVVTNDQEEEDIAKAIALSLEANGGGGGKKHQQHSSNNQNAYPSLRNSNEPGQNSLSNSQPAQQPVKQVRAIYDFLAAEDNEISFKTGEMITVTDDSDQNWWRGINARGVAGLFPVTFITTDLNDPETTGQNDEKGTEIEEGTTLNGANGTTKVQIDENVLLKCIELIEGLDPTMDAALDPPELAFLENMAMAQAPLIDQKLMQIDKQLNQLADVDLAIRDVLGAYDSAVQQVAGSSATGAPVAATQHSPQQSSQVAMSSATPSHPSPMLPSGGGGQWQSQQ